MKRSISLILAIAVMFCFCMTPVFADDEATETTTTTPTATLTASLSGDTEPQAGEVFTVSFDFTDVSTNLFKSAQVAFSWPADVATLYDVEYEEAITDDASAQYSVTVNNVTSGRSNKFTSISTWDVANGTGDFTVYIDPNATDTSSVELTDGTWHFIDVAFILGEDQSYEDFSLSITKVKAYFTAAGTDIESSMADGTVTTKGISGSVSDPTTVTVDDVTYDVVSSNYISNGYFTDGTVDGWTEASAGGALPWEVVESENFASGYAMHLVGDSTGGAGTNTMRTFFPVEGGKKYYVTETVYNVGSSTTDSMNAVVATGAAAFGALTNVTVYSIIDYGGVCSWTSSETAGVGTTWSRGTTTVPTGYPSRSSSSQYQDIELDAGELAVIEMIINVPEAAENIMFSAGAWGSTNIYYGDFAIYEVEEQTETPTEEPTDAETEEPTEEETIEGAYYAVAGQNAEGIYDLPEEITGKATVTFKGAVLQSVDNTLIGINNADLMTTNSYFTNSSVMLLINADGALSYRDGSSTVSSGVNLTVGEEYDFTYEIDVTSATWGVTIADADGNVVFTISDLAFRTTADVLDSIVLVNNNSVDKTAYVRDIVVTVEEEPTDEETEEPTDEETEEPTEETTLPEDAVVSVTGQSEEAIVALEEAITTTGTVEFTLVVDTTQTNDTLVALTNGEAMASNTNYFANAGVQFMISGTTLKARIDGNTEEVGTVESGVEYTFTVSVDVENQTWSAVVTDSEGNQVAVVEETAFRSESALESIDSIVILDNAGGVESAYAYAITVTTESTGGDDEDLSVEVTDYTYTDGGQVIATVGLIDGATEPTDTIVYIVSFTKDGSPLGIVAGEIAVGGTINVSNSDSTGVAAISFVTGITVEDVSPVDGDSDLGTPVGVYYPAE